MNSNCWKTELILLIEEYLYNANLIQSYLTIEKETSVSLFSYSKELSFIRKLIIDGLWDECIKFLKPLQYQNNFDIKEAMYQLKLEKFIESMENENNYDQNDFEKQLSEIKVLCSKETFASIIKMLQPKSFKDNKEYKNWTPLSGRYNCFMKIRELLNGIFPMKDSEIKINNNILEKTLLKLCGEEKVNQGEMFKQINHFLINKQNAFIQKEEKETKKSTNKTNTSSQLKTKEPLRPISKTKQSTNINNNILEPSIPPLTITAINPPSNISSDPYDPSSFYLGALLVDPQAIRTSCFNPKGDHIAIGTNSRTLKIYDLSPITKLFSSNSNSTKIVSPSLPLLFEKENHHQGSIYTLDWSNDGELIASGSNDKIIKIIVSPDANSTNILEMVIPGHKGTVRSVLFNPEDKGTLFSGGTIDTNIFLWDTESGKQKGSLIGHSSDIHSIKSCLIPSVHLIGSCEKNNIVNFWDIRSNQIQNTITLKKHSSANDLSFSTSLVAVAHTDGYISIIDYLTKAVIKEIKVSDSEVRSVNFSQNGKYLLCGGFDHKIRIYDVCNDFNQIKVLDHEDRVVSCKWHHQLPIISSTSADKTARVWIPKIY